MQNVKELSTKEMKQIIGGKMITECLMS
ncbi:TPA: bacteriocin [Enterococcus faecium]